MRVLVTGGAGFIGSHLCERLLGDGHEVAIIDDLNDYYPAEWKRRNLASIGQVGTFQFLQLDICEAEQVFAAVARFAPEQIVHLAARVGVRPSLEQPLLYERVNVYGSNVLLEAARRARVAKFVFASSSSVYGATSRSPFREDEPNTLPVSPYAATKLAVEKLCHEYAHLYGIGTVCLRLFTVYGPRQRPDLAIRKFARLIRDGKPVPMYGDGSTERDYTMIDDTVDGIVSAIRGDFHYEVFNLGNSRPIPLREMIAAIGVALDREPVIERHPDQPGDVPLTCADISKAGRRLGYHPRVPFEQGIRRFAEWFLAEDRP